MVDTWTSGYRGVVHRARESFRVGRKSSASLSTSLAGWQYLIYEMAPSNHPRARPCKELAMALLTPRVLLVLRNLTNDLGHCLYENGEMGSAACWNWALTGFSATSVWPENLYNYFAGIPANGIPARHGAAWFGNAGNMAALNGIVHTYNTNVGAGALAALHTAAQAVAVLAVDGNGLTRSAVATDYELVMEYQTRDTAPPHRVCAPSFQHWWLSVQGRAIEIFPGRTEIQIYQGHQPVNPLRFSMWSTYLTGFHQAQVDRIVRVLRDTRANWQGVPAVPGGASAMDRRRSAIALRVVRPALRVVPAQAPLPALR